MRGQLKLDKAFVEALDARKYFDRVRLMRAQAANTV
jgi:hypothetical protein